MPGIGFFQGVSASRRSARVIDDPAHAFDDLVQPFDEFVGLAERIDDQTLQQIVGGAKAGVPIDTGRLLNGISGSREGDTRVAQAHAIASDGEDYASIVEHGRGGAVHANADFFAGDGARALDTHRGADVPPHPYFFAASAEPLSQRFRAMLTGLGRYFDRAGFDG